MRHKMLTAATAKGKVMQSDRDIPLKTHFKLSQKVYISLSHLN